MAVFQYTEWIEMPANLVVLTAGNGVRTERVFDVAVLLRERPACAGCDLVPDRRIDLHAGKVV